jgi:hypothetical protein
VVEPVESLGHSPARCANCGAVLCGEYCHVCGQQQANAKWLTAGPFLQHFGNELVSLDFKSVRSLMGLVVPGFLAAEFLSGRRRPYLSPLKMYFLAATIFFLVAPHVSGFRLDALLRQDDDGTLRAMVDERMAATHMAYPLFAERFNLRLKTVYTLSLGVSAIAVALILRLLYRRSAPAMGTHVVFALYYVAFFFFVAIAIGGLNQALGLPGPFVLFAITYGILTPYVFLALERVYAEPSGLTFAKTLALLVFAFIIDSPINIAARLLTIAWT